MRFSLCIPTHNRADLLDHTLSNLPKMDCEVVISDNASTDNTRQVVEKHGHSYFALPENRGAFANFRNAVFKAKTDIIVYLADDDSILPEPLMEHVSRMEAESLTAIFTDSIAWDDEKEEEIHRYFQGVESQTFTRDPFGLVNFVLASQIPPEVGVFRRSALIRSIVPYSRSMHFHLWMYNLSRLGPIRFDTLAFYREHRVLKPHLNRPSSNNLDMAMQYMGDEQRLGLENMAMMAMLDAGAGPLDEQGKAHVHAAIDRMLHNRTSLEIQRAVWRGDYILAVELRRRQTLWHGWTDGEVETLVKPAAQQALKAYEGCDDPPTIPELMSIYRIGSLHV